MKKIILCLFVSAILLASCGTVKYTNKIESRTISQQCHFSPLTDSLRDLYRNGYISINEVHEGIFQIWDSVYVIQPCWSQVHHYDRLHNTSWEFWVGSSIMGSTVGSFALLTSLGIGAPEFTLVPMAGIYIGGSLIGGSSEWYRANGDRDILKTDYVNSYSKSDSAKANFWYTTVVSY